MNIFNNVLVKLSIFSSIYVTILIFLSPFIDHLFTSLDKDKKSKISKKKILIEIILHVILITIIWFFLNSFLRYHIKSLLKIEIKEATKTAIDFVSAIVLVGLQKNLIDKLEYITLEHPIRLIDIFN